MKPIECLHYVRFPEIPLTLEIEDPELNPYENWFETCDPDVQVYETSNVSAKADYKRA